MTINEHIIYFESATGKHGTYSRAAKKFIKWMISKGYREISKSILSEYTLGGGFSKSYESITKKYCYFIGFGRKIPAFDTKELKSLDGELWVDVIDSKRLKVSNKGRLKNTETGKIIKGSVNKKDGYIRLSCNWKQESPYNEHKKTRTIHSVVFFSFNPELYPPKGNVQIDHTDRDRGNNSLENLRLLTVIENMANKYTISPELVSEIISHHKEGLSPATIHAHLCEKYWVSLAKKGRKSQQDG